jgi:hypothetical protein
MNKRVYKGNIVGILKELTDVAYQRHVWSQADRKPGMTISYVEAICMLFDDCVVGDYLEEGEILFDRKTTAALHELDAAVEAVDASDNNGGYRSQEDIINDPLMAIVRLKAAYVLALIQASDGKESTVEIIE